MVTLPTSGKWMTVGGFFDMPAIEGNRAQAETKEDAIQSAIRGIKTIKMTP